MELSASLQTRAGQLANLARGVVDACVVGLYVAPPRAGAAPDLSWCLERRDALWLARDLPRISAYSGAVWTEGAWYDAVALASGDTAIDCPSEWRFAALTPLALADGTSACLLVADVEEHRPTTEQLDSLAELAALIGNSLGAPSSEKNASALEWPGQMASLTGQAYVEWLVVHLARELDADFAWVGQLTGEAWDSVETCGLCIDGELRDQIEYPLCGAPCEEIYRHGSYFHAKDLWQQFPRDAMLKEYDLASFAGVVLNDSLGRPIGQIAIMARAPMTNETRILAELDKFRERTEQELDRERSIVELRSLVEGASRTTSEGMFRFFVENLARTCRVRMAFLAEHLGDGRARTLAHWIDGEFQESITYDIDSTGPCGLALENHWSFIGSGVRDEYPSSDLLNLIGAESYASESLMDNEGQIIGHLGIVHSTTLPGRPGLRSLFSVFSARCGAELQRRRSEQERLAVERQMMDTQRLDSLGRLAGGLAHDVNNLLVSILGNANMATISLPSSAKEQKYLSEIIKSSKSAASLADQLLAYSGQGRFVVELQDVRAVLRSMRSLLEVSLPKSCSLEMVIAEGLPMVSADSAQLRQIVLNVVMNAGESCPETDGRVKVHVDSRYADAKELSACRSGSDLKPGEYVVLEVTDNGCGMPQDVVNRIQEPFFTTKFTGRGLGLAAVQGILRRHGAGLLVRSRTGKGSSFTIFLPAISPVDVVRRDENSDGAELFEGSGSALVVDDERGVRVVLSDMLTRLGFETEVAMGGEEAIGLLDQEAGWSVIFLDLTMPRPDGREVLARIREVCPHTPVVLMSGFDERAVEGLEGLRFLHKPFELSDIRKACHAVLMER